MASDAGSYRKLALATIMLATVGVAFALLITAVELSKDEAQPVYDLNLRRGSPEYRLFLAVRASLISTLKCAGLPALAGCLEPLVWHLLRARPGAAECWAPQGITCLRGYRHTAGQKGPVILPAACRYTRLYDAGMSEAVR